MPTREYKIKAAFLYQFARFVEWPVEKSGEQVVVCVLGENPFGTALENLEGKSIGPKTLTTRHVGRAGDVSNCHMLFLSSSTKGRGPHLLAGVAGKGILTVGETETFTDDGGMIRLLAVGNNIRFAINREAARRAGLQISSRMLRLAVNN